MFNGNIPLIPARYYIKLIELLIVRHIPIDEFLEKSNINLEDIMSQVDVYVSIKHVEKLIEFCLKFPSNRDLAFELGNALHITSHNLVGYAILTSETIEHALTLVTHYFSLIMPSFRAYTHLNNDKSLEIMIEPHLLMSQLATNFQLEAIAVAIYNNINELVNKPISLYPIFLSIPEPIYIGKFNNLTGAKFYFNSLYKPGLKIILSQDILSCKLLLADEMTLKAVELKCQQQMKDIMNSQDIDEWMNNILMHSQHMPTLDKLAQLLNISTKTLQRTLNKKNIDFRSLRKKVMLLKAKQKLKNTEKSITEIAHELGYSSPSNFARAFKLSTGISPEKFRFK